VAATQRKPTHKEALSVRPVARTHDVCPTGARHATAEPTAEREKQRRAAQLLAWQRLWDRLLIGCVRHRSRRAGRPAARRVCR